ncbi:hypothetical protein [Geminocystis herdmanii]|uniref:hypothetical protein n=1 Tax=Geminocystis herdmanii TaxID=669359 RepID=UPI000349AD82|nr:hypothetical protein [Geminocystis herdmanii]
MFDKLFGKRFKNTPTLSETSKADDKQIKTEIVPKKNKFSIEQQRKLQVERKRQIINEFEKSLLNLQIETGIWTPVYIVNLYELDFSEPQTDFAPFIEKSLEDSFAIHKENLKQKIYRESFNLQPAETLIVIKEISGEIFLSFKKFPFNIEKLVELLNVGFLTPSTHKILLLTYFIPPIPDDLYKFDNIIIPQTFEDAIKDIVNYCDRHFNTDNLTFDKWQNLILGLNAQGMIIKFPDSEETVTLDKILTEDYSNIGYHRLKVEEIVKDTVEKNPIVIPFFILLLAFFCSEKSDSQIFTYHYLFSPTGLAKKRLMDNGKISYPKLFNKLLDESLLPNQFRKCLSTIYYEGFILHQYEVDDLLFKFREKYIQSQPKPPQKFDTSNW